MHAACSFLLFLLHTHPNKTHSSPYLLPCDWYILLFPYPLLIYPKFFCMSRSQWQVACKKSLHLPFKRLLIFCHVSPPHDWQLAHRVRVRPNREEEEDVVDLGSNRPEQILDLELTIYSALNAFGSGLWSPTRATIDSMWCAQVGSSCKLQATTHK